MMVQLQSLEHGIVQIEQQELQAEAEREMREMELEKAREAERQKKLDEAAAKQRAREQEIEEREVSLASTCSAPHFLHTLCCPGFKVNCQASPPTVSTTLLAYLFLSDLTINCYAALMMK